jgi:hypothetical protein
MQRAVHGDLDLRLPLVVELDLIDLANGLAADQDLVVVDELAAGLEQQPVVIARPAAREQQEDDRNSARAVSAASRGIPPPPRTRATCGETASSPGVIGRASARSLQPSSCELPFRSL